MEASQQPRTSIEYGTKLVGTIGRSRAARREHREPSAGQAAEGRVPLTGRVTVDEPVAASRRSLILDVARRGVT